MRKEYLVAGEIRRVDVSSLTDQITIVVRATDDGSDGLVPGTSVEMFRLENDPYTRTERAEVSAMLVGERPYEQAKDLMDAMIQRGWRPPPIPPMFKYDMGKFWRKNRYGNYVAISNNEIARMLNGWVNDENTE